MEVSHNDIMVVIILFAVFGLCVLGFVGWMVRDVSRITRAVGTLVIQETAKLRRD
jgi:hypothetical protein